MRERSISTTIRAADEQDKRMTDDHRDWMSERPLPHDGEPPLGLSGNILDALDMAGVGKIEVTFERPPSHLHPATFD